MEYVIREYKGKFDPGAIVERKVWTGLFKRAIEKEFVGYSYQGRLMFYYNHLPTPPPLDSFDTLHDASQWLEKRLNQKQTIQDPVFHSFYNHGNKTTKG